MPGPRKPHTTAAYERITADFINHLYKYNEDGTLTHRNPRGPKAEKLKGQPAGYLFKNRWRVTLWVEKSNIWFTRATLVWLMRTGELPPDGYTAAHQDGNTLNDRFENLYLKKKSHRIMPRHDQNLIPGVSYIVRKDSKPYWVAAVYKNGKRKARYRHTFIDAVQARLDLLLDSQPEHDQVPELKDYIAHFHTLSEDEQKQQQAAAQ